MVNVKYSELLAERIENNSIVPFENTGGLTKRDVAGSLANGSSVILVKSLADLPPGVGGFITLEQNMSYLFLEPFTIVDQIIIPAGWNGFIKSTFLNSTTITINTTLGIPLFMTLNIDGTINSVADAGGGFITVTTAVAHGLLDGQFVNITGTTSYNASQLQVSSVTATTFDVELAFVADESGLFDTGFQRVVIQDIDFDCPFDSNLVDLTGDTSGVSTVVIKDVSVIGVLDIGTIRSASVVGIQVVAFVFGSTGLILEDITNIVILGAQFIAAGVTTTLRGITITGASTIRTSIDNAQFFMLDPDQRPFNIDSSVLGADQISITNSPDDNVADQYFDTAGLDQTDPVVLTKNNGVRADSMARAQVGFTNIATPITVTIVTQDVPVIIGGTQFVNSDLERAQANTAGQITNLTKRPKVYPITFSGLIEKVGGGTTDIGILIIKNGSLVLTETFEIPHSVNAGVIQISATRDINLAENDTIELAVVNFDGTADISVSQANITYTVEA